MTVLCITISVVALLVAAYAMARARAAEVLAARLGDELDEAHLAGAALSIDRGSAATWRKRAQAALHAVSIIDRRRIADACAAVAAHGARELERHTVCAHLDEFLDGELPADRAAAFRDHLARCERCQCVLHGRMQEGVAANAEPVEGGR